MSILNDNGINNGAIKEKYMKSDPAKENEGRQRRFFIFSGFELERTADPSLIHRLFITVYRFVYDVYVYGVTWVGICIATIVRFRSNLVFIFSSSTELLQLHATSGKKMKFVLGITANCQPNFETMVRCLLTTGFPQLNSPSICSSSSLSSTGTRA